MNHPSELRASRRMRSILATLGLLAGIVVTSAGSAAAATCPAVNPITGEVVPSPTPGVDWAGCDLSYADLGSANLAGADLTSSDLSFADLSLADLSAATLSDAWVYHANLSGADLTGAKLYYAFLPYVDLSDANLGHANLTGSDFGAGNLGGANLGYAWAARVGWVGTICPDLASSADHLNGACAPSLSIKAPRKVLAGTRARISGALRDDDPACRAAQQVTLKRGSAILATKMTNATGAYRFGLRIKRKTSVYVIYEGAPTCAGNSSVKKTIRVG